MRIILLFSLFICCLSRNYICGVGKFAKEEEIKFARRNKFLFKQDFPFLWWCNLISIIFLFISLFFEDLGEKGFDKLVYHDDYLVTYVIPFMLPLTILFVYSIRKLSDASEELRRNKPSLNLTVLFMTLSNSVSLYFMFMYTMNYLMGLYVD